VLILPMKRRKLNGNGFLWEAEGEIGCYVDLNMHIVPVSDVSDGL
jgi:hypothetical protein